MLLEVVFFSVTNAVLGVSVLTTRLVNERVGRGEMYGVLCCWRRWLLLRGRPLCVGWNGGIGSCCRQRHGDNGMYPCMLLWVVVGVVCTWLRQPVE